MNQLESVLLRAGQNRLAQKYPKPAVVIAVPVFNEAERIDRCVAALTAQCDRSGCLLPDGFVRVVLLTNNCTDGSYELIVEGMQHWQVALSVLDVSLPKSRRNAGCARRLANHAALDLVPQGSGLLFMTDADSSVPSQWVATYTSFLRSGYDAVAGSVDLHPEDCADIPLSLHQRGQLEGRYSELLDRLDAFIDPLPHDPWPRHYNASGANIAVRVSALRGIDDFPDVACGEDRLFIRWLEAHGRRVRHDSETRVYTSGRLIGRATGGMADTLRKRVKVPNTPCDPRLEAVDRAHFRAVLRASIRRSWADPAKRHALLQSWADLVGVDVALVSNTLDAKTFEAAWQNLEGAVPLLERHPLSPSELPREIRRAEHMMNSLFESTADVSEKVADQLRT
ncbi:MAG: glycosyltransferase [Pseudomonadota bacterium]|nr:glycosyltransferase [Pseudomonadota bacterium]